MKGFRFMLGIIVFSFAMTTITGCGLRDIEKRFFVVGMGIDQAEQPDHFHITLKLAVPESEPQKKQRSSLTLDAQGASISDAVRKINAKVNLDLDFGQMKAVIFGEGLAKEDLAPSLDWVMRRWDIEYIAFLGIGTPDAATIISKEWKTEVIPSNALLMAFRKSNMNRNLVTPVQLFEFYRSFREKGISPALPMISLEKKSFVIDRIAIFEKGNKLAVKTQSTPSETEIHNLLVNRKPFMVFHVHRSDLNFIMNVQSVRTVYTIDESQNEHPIIKLDVYLEGIVEESLRPTNEKHMKVYQVEIEKAVQARVLSYLNRMRDQGMDPVGFGLKYRAIHANMANEWEQWGEMYPNVQFQVNPHVKLRNTGYLK